MRARSTPVGPTAWDCSSCNAMMQAAMLRTSYCMYGQLPQRILQPTDGKQQMLHLLIMG